MDPGTKGWKYEWLCLPLKNSAFSPMDFGHGRIGGHGL